MPISKEIIQAYRSLSKATLRAVQYSQPARTISRDRIREAFRSSRPSDFDPVKVQRTLEFLENATRFTGLEHRIVKNLYLVWFWREKQLQTNMTDSHKLALRQVAFEEFDRTIEQLNESMNLCLR